MQFRSDAIETRHPANRITWRDHALEVTARIIPRYLWSTASIDVYLDGTALIRTGGVMRLKGVNEAQFDEGGETHQIELSWASSSRGMALPYQLLVDGEVILQSKVTPRNWPMVLMPVFMAGALLILIGLAVRH